MAQALALAICLIDYELEEPAVTPPPPQWEWELKAALKLLRAELNKLSPPGRYVGQWYGRPSNGYPPIPTK